MWHVRHMGLAALVVLGGCRAGGAGAPAAAGSPASAGAGSAAAGDTAGATARSEARVIDAFEDPGAWSAHPADGVALVIGAAPGGRGRCLRLDFDFHGGGGYAVARRAVDLDLPENYAFSFRIRGDGPTNHLEFKLVDTSGDNVWWSVRRDVRFPRDWDTFTIKKRHISFAWGPRGGGEIRRVAAIEFAITAGSGGRGTVWLDELELRPLPPPGATPPPPLSRASSEARGQPARFAVDGDTTTAWEPEVGDGFVWVALDFQEHREYGGLVVVWREGQHATDYDVEISSDGVTWGLLRAVRGSNGGRDPLALPESESRHLRLRPRAAAAGRIAICEIQLQPLEWAATRTAFFEALAREAPRGTYPRGMSGEQTYWTVVGLPGDEREALLGEDGALETGRGEFSVEPFLFHAGRLVTWADVQPVQLLDAGSLPIPSVRWRHGDLEFEILAFATGEAGRGEIVTRYRLTNRGASPLRATLFLAMRPFQVNPPAQFLNMQGGAAPIRSLEFDGRMAKVNRRSLYALTAPAGAGAVHFDGGDVVLDFLRTGRLPTAPAVTDSFEAASGAFAFDFELAPAQVGEAALLVPLHAADLHSPAWRRVPTGSEAERAWVEEKLALSRAVWNEKLGRVGIQLPDSAVTRSLRSQLGWILVNAAGPAIQPGTRAYARSWIRDGALTSSALLRLGHPEVATAFLDWFAPHQYATGKVPCVVDSRGADPTPEHDSTGEFIFLVAEILRYTGDTAVAARHWPRIVAAVAYIDSLRQQRRTDEYRTAATRHFYGLLPPSISHEGYSAKPMHSYWDDFWAVRGLRDAVFLAAALGHPAEQARFAASRDEFERDVAASVLATLETHQIDYVPGSADLGDFDATSTTILLAPVQAAELVPRAALLRTFEKYDTFFRERLGGADWEAFTPYEIRNIGAFVRLGWRVRAAALLDYFLAQQRPPAWRQWPEVVWRDPRAPRFLGDLPHGWVGSDFVRSVLDMLAYEREADSSLVLAAGVPVDWLRQGGVAVRDLPTPYGSLSYTLQLEEDAVVLRLAPGLRLPPGGVVVSAPLPWKLGTASVEGVPFEPGADGAVILRRVPATLTLRR